MLACCARYVANVLPILGLSAARGFSVSVRGMCDVMPIKERYGVPNDLWSFHTAVVGGYMVEGHVPLVAVCRLLAEKPAVKGIALPGMQKGQPGMWDRRSNPSSSKPSATERPRSL
jgi:hypothetical protein